MKINEDSLLCNDLLFICIFKNSFLFYIVTSLFYSRFALFNIIGLILHINLYFDIEFNEL